jgi:hypothetical protein
MLDTFPRILVYPAAVIERADGKLLVFADTSLGRDVVPTRIEELPGHREKVKSSCQALLANILLRLGQERSVSPLSNFRGFPSIVLRGSASSVVPRDEPDRPSCVKSVDDRTGEFVVVTGEHTHFILAQSELPSCPGHDWSAIHAIGKQVAAPPVLSSSVDPRSYFESRSTHHCAHIDVHDLRVDKCFIEMFETYLCCKACVFQPICWPGSEVKQLPCIVANAGSAASATSGVAS